MSDTEIPDIEITDYRAALMAVLLENGGHLKAKRQHIEDPTLMNEHELRVLNDFGGKVTLRLIPKEKCQFDPCDDPQDPRCVVVTFPGTDQETHAIMCPRHFKAITGKTI